MGESRESWNGRRAGGGRMVEYGNGMLPLRRRYGARARLVYTLSVDEIRYGEQSRAVELRREEK